MTCGSLVHIDRNAVGFKEGMDFFPGGRAAALPRVNLETRGSRIYRATRN